jgi:hypothetical protein
MSVRLLCLLMIPDARTDRQWIAVCQRRDLLAHPDLRVMDMAECMGIRLLIPTNNPATQ